MKNAALLTLVVLMCTTMSFAQVLKAPGSTTVLTGRTWDAAVDGSGETIYDAQYWDLTAGDITISYSVDLTDATLVSGGMNAPTYAPVRFGQATGDGTAIDQDYCGWFQSALGWGDASFNANTFANGYTVAGQEDEYSFMGDFPGVYDGHNPYTDGAGSYTLDGTLGNGFKYDQSTNPTHDIEIYLQANVGDYSGTAVHSAYAKVDGEWQVDASGNKLGFDFTGDVTEMYLGLGWNSWDWNGQTGGGSTTIGDITVTQVPEPATMSLLGLGGLGVLIRRKKK